MSPLDIGGLTPEEITRLSKSVQSREQSPSTRQQTAEYANWRALADAPADPFNVERIPINRLRQMRRDPMIGFGLHFIRTPIIRAPWYIRCEDAQIASFVDYALRRIYTRLVNQYMLALDFGFSGIAKKFVQEPIKETYFDPNDVDQQESPDDFLLPGAPQAPSELQGKRKPVWSEGSVLPIIWKPFVPLPPEDVEVIFNNKGEFDGIKFTPRFQVQATGIGASKASNEGELEIDVYHALWITNERDSVFGNVFGYPRIGYATNYWWSYWHQHGLSDRHFEKDADPPTVVRHPQGNYQDEFGDTIAFRELALDIGDRVRAGSTIAIPSEVYTTMDDRPSNTPKWSIDFLKGGGNFEAFMGSFDYLNVMKLRAIWVPEQALIEGKGGQSSRNVADTFGDSFQESQGVLISEFDQHLNQFVIPQLVALNFPEFEGKVEKVTRGFSNKDVETMRQLIQLTGQTDISKLPIDTRQMLEELGVPLLDIENQAANAEQAGLENAPGVVPAIPGQQAGTVPTPGNNTEQANPGSAFSYVQPPERISIETLGISLADDFLQSLPATPHYSDKIMRSYASQIWLQFNHLYKEMYADYIDFLLEEDLAVNLADEPEWVKKLVGRWNGKPEVWVDTITNVTSLYRRALTRAGKLSLQKARLKAQWSGDDNESSEWINTKINNLVTSVSSTINDDLTRSTAIAVRDLEDPSPESVATALRSYFSDYPNWQATRVARTEVRDIWNNATLMAGQAAGVTQVQAVDAQFGDTDEDCHDRDGEIFGIADAFDVPEHPNGTLAWRLLASDNLTIEKSEDEQLLASYDPDSETVFLSDSLTDGDKKSYLKALGGKLEHGSK